MQKEEAIGLIKNALTDKVRFDKYKDGSQFAMATSNCPTGVPATSPDVMVQAFKLLGAEHISYKYDKDNLIQVNYTIVGNLPAFKQALTIAGVKNHTYGGAESPGGKK